MTPMGGRIVMKSRLRGMLLRAAAFILCAAAVSCTGGVTLQADPEEPEQTAQETVPPGEAVEDSSTEVETNAPEEETGSDGMVLYVDCAAEESGDGSRSAPYWTLEEADAEIAAMKRGEGLPEGGVKVLVSPGEYPERDGFVLKSGGGTETSPVRYVSEVPGGAVLSGGTRLDGEDFVPLSEEEQARIIDREAAGRILKVDLKQYGKTAEDWGQLYSYGAYHQGSRYENGTGPAEAELICDGVRMRLARYPNEGWCRTGKILKPGAPLNTAEADPDGPTFAVSDDVTERMNQWQSFDDVWTFGYFMYDWADASNPLEAVTTTRRIITLGHLVFYGIRENQRFYFFNVFEELDAPGEYYLDRENGILYLYPPREPEEMEIVLSDSSAAIVSGTASWLTLEGFTIRCSKGNGITLSGDHVTVDGCTVTGVRGVGMDIRGTDMTVRNCEIASVGGAGLTMSGGDNAALIRSGNLVYNNRIHDWSEVVRSCQNGVTISGCGNTVSHNEIWNAPHQAVGWSGAYNVIEYNEVHHVCHETSDCGALYAGRNFTTWGSEVRYNYIHDIGFPGADAVGIYLDDGMSGQTVRGNLIVNTSAWGMLIGGGRGNTIEGNVIVDPAKEAIYHDSRLRDGEFSGGWYGTMASRGSQFTDLLSICRNGAWSAAFPELSNLKTSSAGEDRDDPLLACNPAGSSVKGNMLYRSGDGSAAAYWVADAVTQFSEVSANESATGLGDFPEHENGVWTMAEDSEAAKKIPGFEPPPFEQMGTETAGE